jgi:hypothetical protein
VKTPARSVTPNEMLALFVGSVTLVAVNEYTPDVLGAV